MPDRIWRMLVGLGLEIQAAVWEAGIGFGSGIFVVVVVVVVIRGWRWQMADLDVVETLPSVNEYPASGCPTLGLLRCK